MRALGALESQMQIIKMDLSPRVPFHWRNRITSASLFVLSVRQLFWISVYGDAKLQSMCWLRQTIFRSSARLRALQLRRDGKSQLSQNIYASRSSLNAPRRMRSVGGLIWLSQLSAVTKCVLVLQFQCCLCCLNSPIATEIIRINWHRWNFRDL